MPKKRRSLSKRTADRATNDLARIVTLEGISQPRLILGLGNPGSKYRKTRHNLGFEVVDELARRRSIELSELVCSSLIAESNGVWLAQPQTYMNRSGYAARCLVEHKGIRPEDCLVVYDDVNLPLGRLRMRSGGSPGGHRGMESIMQSLTTDRISRLRMGISSTMPSDAKHDLVEFVLSPFDPEELESVNEMCLAASDACESWLANGVQETMNRING